jgi:Aerotolerance regulator N-terminal/von Willebrand factor type A domain
MSFLSPLYLIGAALIALPIVLHLLRRDVAPQLPFTAVRLLRVSPIERSRRRRLRDILLLLARVAALLLLAGSFARPYITGARSTNRTTVIAVDRSLSMSAPGVMEKAWALARQAVDEAGRDRVLVIAFDQRADAVAASGTAADARLAIDDIKPSFGATRYASAFDKASDLLPDGAPGRLVLVGDLQRNGFDDSTAVLPKGFELVIRDAGGAKTNLAVTDIRPEARRLIATVRNFGPAARETDVRLESAGRTEITRRVTVPPAASLDVPFEGMASRAAVDVALSDADGFAGDNVRYAVSEPRGTPRVLIVGGGPGSTAGFYLARALEAEDESATGFAVRIVHGPEFAAMVPAEISQYPVIALLSTHGLDRRVRDLLHGFLAAGGGLLIAAAPDVDPSVLSTVLDWQPALTARDRADAGVLAISDLRHPIFRPFDAVAANLGQVSFQHAWQLQPVSAWRVIASYTQGMPALVERAAGQGRIVLFTSDLDRRWNDFPLHPAFVPFAQQTVRYLGARVAETAMYLVADVPAGVPARPGIMQAEGRTLAVNIDARESSIDRVTPSDFAALVTRTNAGSGAPPARVATQTEARQGYWRYGLMLMLAALVAECFVGSK